MAKTNLEKQKFLKDVLSFAKNQYSYQADFDTAKNKINNEYSEYNFGDNDPLIKAIIEQILVKKENKDKKIVSIKIENKPPINLNDETNPISIKINKLSSGSSGGGGWDEEEEDDSKTPSRVDPTQAGKTLVRSRLSVQKTNLEKRILQLGEGRATEEDRRSINETILKINKALSDIQNGVDVSPDTLRKIANSASQNMQRTQSTTISELREKGGASQTQELEAIIQRHTTSMTKEQRELFEKVMRTVAFTNTADFTEKAQQAASQLPQRIELIAKATLGMDASSRENYEKMAASVSATTTSMEEFSGKLLGLSNNFSKIDQDIQNMTGGLNEEEKRLIMEYVGDIASLSAHEIKEKFSDAIEDLGLNKEGDRRQLIYDMRMGLSRRELQKFNIEAKKLESRARKGELTEKEFVERLSKIREELDPKLFGGIGEGLFNMTKALTGSADALQKLKNSSNMFVQEFGETFEKLKAQRKDFLKGGVSDFTTKMFTGNILSKSLFLIPGFGPILSGGFGLLSMATTGIISLAKSTFSLVQTGLKAIGDIVGRIVNFSKSVLRKTFRWGLMSLGLLTVLYKTGLLEKIPSIVSNLWKTLYPLATKIITEVFKAMNETLEFLVAKIRSSLETGLIRRIPEMIFSFVRGIFSGKEANAIGTELSRFGRNLGNMGKLILKAMKELWSGISELWRKELWPNYIKPSFQYLAREIPKWISGLFNSIKSWFSDTALGQWITKNILDPFKSALSSLVGAIYDIVLQMQLLASFMMAQAILPMIRAQSVGAAVAGTAVAGTAAAGTASAAVPVVPGTPTPPPSSRMSGLMKGIRGGVGRFALPAALLYGAYSFMGGKYGVGSMLGSSSSNQSSQFFGGNIRGAFEELAEIFGLREPGETDAEKLIVEMEKLRKEMKEGRISEEIGQRRLSQLNDTLLENLRESTRIRKQVQTENMLSTVEEQAGLSSGESLASSAGINPLLLGGGLALAAYAGPRALSAFSSRRMRGTDGSPRSGGLGERASSAWSSARNPAARPAAMGRFLRGAAPLTLALGGYQLATAENNAQMGDAIGGTIGALGAPALAAILIPGLIGAGPVGWIALGLLGIGGGIAGGSIGSMLGQSADDRNEEKKLKEQDYRLARSIEDYANALHREGYSEEHERVGRELKRIADRLADSATTQEERALLRQNLIELRLEDRIDIDGMRIAIDTWTSTVKESIERYFEADELQEGPVKDLIEAVESLEEGIRQGTISQVDAIQQMDNLNHTLMEDLGLKSRIYADQIHERRRAVAASGGIFGAIVHALTPVGPTGDKQREEGFAAIGLEYARNIGQPDKASSTGPTPSLRRPVGGLRQSVANLRPKGRERPIGQDEVNRRSEEVRIRQLEGDIRYITFEVQSAMNRLSNPDLPPNERAMLEGRVEELNERIRQLEAHRRAEEDYRRTGSMFGSDHTGGSPPEARPRVTTPTSQPSGVVRQQTPSERLEYALSQARFARESGRNRLYSPTAMGPNLSPERRAELEGIVATLTGRIRQLEGTDASQLPPSELDEIISRLNETIEVIKQGLGVQSPGILVTHLPLLVDAAEKTKENTDDILDSEVSLEFFNPETAPIEELQEEIRGLRDDISHYDNEVSLKGREVTDDRGVLAWENNRQYVKELEEILLRRIEENTKDIANNTSESAGEDATEAAAEAGAEAAAQVANKTGKTISAAIADAVKSVVRAGVDRFVSATKNTASVVQNVTRDIIDYQQGEQMREANLREANRLMTTPVTSGAFASVIGGSGIRPSSNAPTAIRQRGTRNLETSGGKVRGSRRTNNFAGQGRVADHQTTDHLSPYARETLESFGGEVGQAMDIMELESDPDKVKDMIYSGKIYFDGSSETIQRPGLGDGARPRRVTDETLRDYELIVRSRNDPKSGRKFGPIGRLDPLQYQVQLFGRFLTVEEMRKAKDLADERLGEVKDKRYENWLKAESLRRDAGELTRIYPRREFEEDTQAPSQRMGDMRRPTSASTAGTGRAETPQAARRKSYAEQENIPDSELERILMENAQSGLGEIAGMEGFGGSVVRGMVNNELDTFARTGNFSGIARKTFIEPRQIEMETQMFGRPLTEEERKRGRELLHRRVQESLEDENVAERFQNRETRIDAAREMMRPQQTTSPTAQSQPAASNIPLASNDIANTLETEVANITGAVGETPNTNLLVNASNQIQPPGIFGTGGYQFGVGMGAGFGGTASPSGSGLVAAGMAQSEASRDDTEEYLNPLDNLFQALGGSGRLSTLGERQDITDEAEASMVQPTELPIESSIVSDLGGPLGGPQGRTRRSQRPNALAGRGDEISSSTSPSAIPDASEQISETVSSSVEGMTAGATGTLGSSEAKTSSGPKITTVYDMIGQSSLRMEGLPSYFDDEKDIKRHQEMDEETLRRQFEWDQRGEITQRREAERNAIIARADERGKQRADEERERWRRSGGRGKFSTSWSPFDDPEVQKIEAEIDEEAKRTVAENFDSMRATLMSYSPSTPDMTNQRGVVGDSNQAASSAAQSVSDMGATASLQPRHYPSDEELEKMLIESNYRGNLKEIFERKFKREPDAQEIRRMATIMQTKGREVGSSTTIEERGGITLTEARRNHRNQMLAMGLEEDGSSKENYRYTTHSKENTRLHGLFQVEEDNKKAETDPQRRRHLNDPDKKADTERKISDGIEQMVDMRITMSKLSGNYDAANEERQREEIRKEYKKLGVSELTAEVRRISDEYRRFAIEEHRFLNAIDREASTRYAQSRLDALSPAEDPTEDSSIEPPQRTASLDSAAELNRSAQELDDSRMGAAASGSNNITTIVTNAPNINRSDTNMVMPSYSSRSNNSTPEISHLAYT